MDRRELWLPLNAQPFNRLVMRWLNGLRGARIRAGGHGFRAPLGQPPYPCWFFTGVSFFMGRCLYLIAIDLETYSYPLFPRPLPGPRLDIDVEGGVCLKVYVVLWGVRREDTGSKMCVTKKRGAIYMIIAPVVSLNKHPQARRRHMKILEIFNDLIYNNMGSQQQRKGPNRKVQPKEGRVWQILLQA